MLPYLAALLLAANPAPEFTPPTERVDLIEENHYFDENGVHLLDQAIFFDWSEKDGRYQVAAWRLIKTAANRPHRAGDGYEMIWSEGGAFRRVLARKYRETFTQYAPELLERKHLPREERRELFTKPKVDDPMPPGPPDNNRIRN